MVQGESVMSDQSIRVRVKVVSVGAKTEKGVPMTLIDEHGTQYKCVVGTEDMAQEMVNSTDLELEGTPGEFGFN